MTACIRCESPARWRDADGRHYCSGHVPANGKPLARLPAPPEMDIADRLEFILDQAELKTINSICEGGPSHFVSCETIARAAAEIRRLRALLKAVGDKSGAC
jgi:hypothetical protein